MLDLQCELSCDEAVLRGANNDARQKYIGLMTGIAPQQNKCQDASPASFIAGKGMLCKRISSIMDNGEKRAGLAVALCATFCMVLVGAALSGFAHPSVAYMEKKWRMNTHFNEQAYLKEPVGNGLDEFPFMGLINIIYAFDKAEPPLRLGVSAYDVIVINGVDLTDKWAASALAGHCLSLAFGNGEGGGLTGSKPRQSQYTYAIELPQDLGRHL